jgi:simple sugar transport system ATP-binding protein
VFPLMTIARNFMAGSEPARGLRPLGRFDNKTADRIAREELERIGIRVSNMRQLVGTLSGGERQSLAIARAERLGARVLILDEPTSALGVKEAAIVLRHVLRARASGRAVILITHNPQHALPVGNRFSILSQGRLVGTYRRSELSEHELIRLMGGGEELDQLRDELAATQ